MTTLKTKRQAFLSICATLLTLSTFLIVDAQETPSAATDQGATGKTPTSEPFANPTVPNNDAAARLLAEKLRFSLSGYEYFPSRADLDRIGSPNLVIDELIHIASSPDERPSLRVRAIDALGYYDDAASTEFLDKQIRTASPPPNTRVARSIRHHSIASFAKAARENGLETLKPLVEDSDLQIRLTAINAIGKHAGKNGRNVLKSLETKTQHPAVLRELRKFGIAE